MNTIISLLGTAATLYLMTVGVVIVAYVPFKLLERHYD